MLLEMIYAEGFPFFTENLSSVAATRERNNTIQTEGKGQRVQDHGEAHEASKSEVQPWESLLMQLGRPRGWPRSHGTVIHTGDLSYYDSLFSIATLRQDVLATWLWSRRRASAMLDGIGPLCV